jgi:hypothetical protein
MHDANRGTTIDVEQIVTAFLDESGLPRFMVDDAVPLDLEKTSRWFLHRVLGQPEAIELLVDLLASVKAGLGRPRKPLGSLLLIGPTGVGKTELAKVLALFLFGSEERLTRFDMSEYSDPLAVGRLTGGFGTGEGLLTAKLREQPFSVVLFDEVEKAHPLFFDLLLQMLGEGRLTDSVGRVADFSSAVVLMTSNLGADSFRRQPVGFEGDDSGVEAMRGVIGKVREFFRPELIGRMDRIVPFGPLDRDTLERIARRQLASILRRDGVALRGLDLGWDEGVSSYLAGKGYDPRYGARPLRRAIERELLAPLASSLNRHVAGISLQARVSVQPRESGSELEVALTTRQGTGTSEAKATAGLSGSKIELDQATVVSTLRRTMQKVRRGSAVRGLINDIFRLERLKERVERLQARSRPVPEYLLIELGRIRELRGVHRLLDAVWIDLCALEDHCMLRLYRRDDQVDDPPVPGVPRQLKDIERRWDEALLELYCLRFPRSNRITLAVYAEDAVGLATLTQAYRDAIHASSLEAIEERWFVGEDEETGKSVVKRAKVREPAPGEPQRDPTEGALGLAFEIRGKAAFPRFAGEAGLHVLKAEERRMECVVHCSELSGEDYKAPEGIERRQALKGHTLRRLYQLDQKQIVERQLELKVRYGRGKSLGDALCEVVEANLRAEIAKGLNLP